MPRQFLGQFNAVCAIIAGDRHNPSFYIRIVKAQSAVKFRKAFPTGFYAKRTVGIYVPGLAKRNKPPFTLTGNKI